MRLQQRLAVLALASVVTLVVFMLAGLPYGKFSWVNAVASYLDPDQPEDSQPDIPPVIEVDPATQPPVYIELGDAATTIKDLLPEGGMLFAPVVETPYIGVPALLDRGVIAAFDFMVFVDGRTVADPFKSPLKACLKGNGALIFLAADQAPRVAVELPLVASDYPGYSCTLIDRPGTLVLVEG